MLKNQQVIDQLTLEQKAALVSGKTEWQTAAVPGKVPAIFMSDGPHGLRKQEGEGDHLGLNASVLATCFPTAATLANSWDPQVTRLVGQALGTEAKAHNVQVVLGPGMNTKRNPKCGRNFEYFSEDPYLAGKMGAGMVSGIQENGTKACLKHFAANSQEYRRMASNSVVDERTFREIYTTNFEIAVKEGHPGAVMSSYNEVNGTYANENRHLLTDILRKEWGFTGYVVTDWGGDNDHVAGLKAGSNLSMPAQGVNGPLEVVTAVRSGKLDERVLDQRVDELLSAVLSSTATSNERPTVDWDHQHQVARQAAEKSIVLLKNQDHLLPLGNQRVAVIGDFAKTPRYQGAGSSLVNSKQLESIVDQLPISGLNVVGYARGYKRNSPADETLVDEALQLAKNSDVVIFCGGLDEIAESEGLDRKSLSMPRNQNALIQQLATIGKPIVVVLSAGSAITMPWLDKVNAVVDGYLGGEAGASAMLNVLTGKVNPAGKLAETYPLSYADVPFGSDYPAVERHSYYKEGPFVGYRYYETAQVPVQFPFGFGLSYTTFSYDHLTIKDDRVEFDLTNTGNVAGDEIAQLYVGKAESNLIRPTRELKGFTRVRLAAGETKHVTIAFDDKTFRYYDVASHSWQTESGTYQLMVGSSSADIKLTGEIERQGVTVPPRNPQLAAYYDCQLDKVDGAAFDLLYGRAVPVNQQRQQGEALQVNDPLSDLRTAKSWVGRRVYAVLKKKLAASEAAGKPDLNILFLYNMPFRAIAKMTGGAVDQTMVDDILMGVNGHFWRGVGRLIRDYFRNNSRNKHTDLGVK
ncbi:glycoside hydrolase family 3 C-terminal domain-containing protein [uncultured Limosilactobacillus sp.]|uniref:glycoside hydrolase family 3 C-terminal domain-containing protein n=1 Tax=uncultured Limosilactobacillus sp. TaxID=2837629 RepID=UPI0025FA2BA8|nr:glycoside hydrolase family 3 C-terminal domain-containing protein [uncultured Limosilactobacillus sp.]